MSDQSDQEERLEEAFEQLETRQEEPGDSESGANARSSGGAGSAVSVIATVVALIATGLASYAAFVAWELKQGGPTLESRLAGVDARLGQLDARPDLSGEIRRLEEALKTELAASRATTTAELGAALSAIESQVGTSSQDWLLAEAEFLVRMAHHRLQMQRDAEGAIALLAAADDVIRHAEIASGFAIRQAIAEDVAVLELAPSVDVTGYFLRLAALEGQIARLREKQPTFTPTESAPDPVEALPQDADLTARLLGYAARAGGYIGDQFEFRRGHEPIRPLMPQEERYYLEQNLRLKLQTARLALLRQDEVVYATSLESASDWVSGYFDPGDPATANLVAALGELGSARISRDVPQIGKSLAAIRAVMVDFEDAPARNLTRTVRDPTATRVGSADLEGAAPEGAAPEGAALEGAAPGPSAPVRSAALDSAVESAAVESAPVDTSAADTASGEAPSPAVAPAAAADGDGQ